MTYGRMPSRRIAIAGVTVIAMLALLTACEGPAGPQGDTGHTLDWSDTIADANLSDSSFVIGLSFPELADEGGAFFVLYGSGFSAHYENMIWTNAHVLNAVRDSLPFYKETYNSVVAVAVRSGTPVGGERTYVVDLAASVIHPDYDRENSFETTPDLALLRIDASLSDVPSFLPRKFATELRAGQPIGTLGFPGELAFPFRTAVHVATFKDGVISALRPYSTEEESVNPENSRLVQHNLDLSQGTSGSPIFDHNGFIVAVNFGGTTYTVVVQVEPELVVDLPTANIGWGIRVDEAWTLIDHIDGDTASQATAATSRAYPHSSYRVFPEN